MRTQVLKNEVLNVRELRLNLNRFRDRPIPDRTFYRWIKALKIYSVNGNYDSEDLTILIGLVKWLNAGGTMDTFISRLREHDIRNSNHG